MEDSMRRHMVVVLAAFVATVALSACSGDSTAGSGDYLSITYLHRPLQGTIFDDEILPTVCAVAMVSPLPSAPPTVRILDSGGTFQPGSVVVNTLANGSFQACLPLQAGLAPGTHTGTLTVQICKDSACAQPYALSEPSLPYYVRLYHVVPGLTPLTAILRVDGVVATSAIEGLTNNVRTYSLGVKGGQTLDIEPSVSFVYMELSSALTPDPSAYPTLRFRVDALPTGVVIRSAVLTGRAADGRTIRFSFDVTP